MNYEKILNDLKEELEYHLDQTRTESFVSFTMAQYQKGVFTDDDLSELKGYRNGLRLALELLKKLLNEGKNK